MLPLVGTRGGGGGLACDDATPRIAAGVAPFTGGRPLTSAVLVTAALPPAAAAAAAAAVVAAAVPVAGGAVGAGGVDMSAFLGLATGLLKLAEYSGDHAHYSANTSERCQISEGRCSLVV